MAGCVKTIQTNLGATEVAEPRGTFAKIRVVIKIRIFFFYPSTAAYNPADENRQSEKLHSTLDGSRSQSVE
jgi:hypothetical protein